MARARHEAPMAEEPQNKHSFDLSDVEAEIAETKKSTKRRSKTPPPIPEAAKKAHAKKRIAAPVPPEARAKKSAKKDAPVINRIKPFVPSDEQKEVANFLHLREKAKQEAEAEDMTDQLDPDDSEVKEALESVRQTAEESAWDAKIAEAKGKLAEEDAEWEAKIGEAKKKVADDELRKKLPKIPPFKDNRVAAPPEGAEVPEYEEMTVESPDDEPYEEMTIEAAKDEEEMSEDERALAAYREAHPVLTDNEGLRKLGLKAQAEEALSKGYEARLKREAKEAAAKEPVEASGFTGKEAAWFKKGEEEEARQMAEARATIERGGKGELMIETPADIAGNVKEAGALLKAGDLNQREFSLQDYEYLLKERVRVDEELEHAGWWRARQLRKDLAKIQKGGYDGASGSQGLDDYEKQIMAAKSGNGAMRLAAKEQSAPEKKLSFWERLRLGKGR